MTDKFLQQTLILKGSNKKTLINPVLFKTAKKMVMNLSFPAAKSGGMGRLEQVQAWCSGQHMGQTWYEMRQDTCEKLSDWNR